MILLPKLPTVQLKPRERLMAIASGLVVLVVVIDRLVLAPWWGHMQALRRDTQAMEAGLQRYGRLLARKDRILTEVAPYRRYLHPAIASDDLQMATLLKEIEQLAQESHIRLGEVKPLPIESDEVAKRYSLDVRFEATMDEWVEFVYRIETSPLLFEVARAELATQEETPDRLKGQLRVMNASAKQAPAVVAARTDETPHRAQ